MEMEDELEKRSIVIVSPHNFEMQGWTVELREASEWLGKPIGPASCENQRRRLWPNPSPTEHTKIMFRF
jgi:hypothetical protein